jgi:CheY-like chemotaxis protein/KaiC/GvpD/RAD55 family RecA-like ATPase
MQPITGKTIPSGVEPVDRLLGGLEIRQIYLVHGDASGKSLFGIQFLIEGLKRGESCALITGSSPEDAVRRFARLGYDCLEDIYSGRLVILECAEGMVEQVRRLRELSPVLRELEWLMGETHPDRVVFDPITQLIAANRGDAQARAREFATWARDFGSTIVLIASEDLEVVEQFKPLVKESLRLYVREMGEQATRFLAFEKSPSIADQSIEVDPSRGIFLLERTDRDQSSKAEPSVIDLSFLEAEAKKPAPGADLRVSSELAQSGRVSDKRLDVQPPDLGKPAALQPEPVNPLADLLNDLNELMADTSPLDIELPEVGQPAQPQIETQKPMPSSTRANVESAVVTSTTEELLRPPDLIQEVPQQAQTAASASVQPKDFRVLIIDGDPSVCERLARALDEYTVETAGDAVSGLAKLISFKPDLVILDIDLPIIDGFKLLTHIRSSLNMPIIVVSSSHLRASDRIQSMELGADYYITKPFSVKEVKQKARQLIARYRGIDEWITVPAPISEDSKRHSAQNQALEPDGDQYIPYQDFFARVEEKVKESIESGTPFSVVGCRLPQSAERSDEAIFRLLAIIRSMVRDCDLVSMNQNRDLVVLLRDADTSGAKAFINRFEQRAIQEVKQKPSIWLRSFPTLEEATQKT